MEDTWKYLRASAQDAWCTMQRAAHAIAGVACRVTCNRKQSGNIAGIPTMRPLPACNIHAQLASRICTRGRWHGNAQARVFTSACIHIKPHAQGAVVIDVGINAVDDKTAERGSPVAAVLKGRVNRDNGSYDPIML
jgi:hypothetical protein